MRENRQSGSEGGGTENNRFSLPLSNIQQGAPRTSRWRLAKKQQLRNSRRGVRELRS